MIFLNRYFHPDHSATSQMLSDLAFALATASDIDPGDAAPTPRGPRGGPARRIVVLTSRQRYDAPAERLPATETIAGVEVHRVWTSRFGRGNLIGRTLDYATFYLSAAWRLWRVARADDIVVAKTDPPMLSVVTGPVARWRRARTVNWLQDVFPEVAEAIGVGGRAAGSLWRLLRRLRDRSLAAAEMNVVLGARMAERLQATGLPASRIRVIPNWADGRALAPVAHADNPLRSAWGLGDKFVVGDSGNLGRAHEIETIVGAIAELQSSPRPDHATAPPIVWLFVGGGAMFERLREDVARRGLGNVVFQAYQPRSLLAQSLSAADVHLVSLQPALEGLIVPSKIYGVMAVGRPAIFIGDADGEVARLLARHRCGTVVAPGDAKGLAGRILDMACDRAGGIAMGERARVALLAEYDTTVGVGRWSAVLDEVAAEAAT